MPAFQYSARDTSGTSQNGMLISANAEALTAELRSRGMLVLDVQPLPERARSTASWSPSTWLRATSFDAETGFQQLATMLHSGLSLLAALRTVAEQARRPRAAATWNEIADRIEQGTSLAEAMSERATVFSEHVVQLVRVGESSGNLDTALRSAAQHLERMRQMRLTVLNALMYPAIVAAMAMAVTAFLIIGVIPKLQKYLSGRGRTLPAITQNLLDAVAWLQQWAALLGVIFGAGIMALFFIYKWPPGRLALDTLFLKIPIVGRVLRLAGTATLARSLGVLIESGVTLLDGLRTVTRLLGNRALGSRIESARESVLRGRTFAAALGSGNEFMPMLSRMVAVGENSGTLAPVLRELAEFHEAQLVAAIRRMSILIEPIVILVVGSIVGFVYIAFFVALFSLAGGVR